VCQLAFISTATAQDQTETITDESVLQMKKWGMTSDQIIKVLGNGSAKLQFDLSPSAIAKLKAAKVDNSVLEAMFKANLSAAAELVKSLSPGAGASVPQDQKPRSAQMQSAQLQSAQAQSPGPVASSIPDPPAPVGCDASVVFNKTDYRPISTSTNNDVKLPNLGIQLNANSSGGEIYTKSQVWVGYINRLRFSATLGGTVTFTPPPDIPSALNWSQAPVGTPKTPTPSTTESTAAATEKLARPKEPDLTPYGKCADTIQTTINGFQASLRDVEVYLDNVRQSVLNRLNSSQPLVNSVSEARRLADSGIFSAPGHPGQYLVAPPLPTNDLATLRAAITKNSSQLDDWVKQNRLDQNAPIFQRYRDISSRMSSLGAALDKYLSTADNTTSTGATQGKEVSDYESNRTFLDFWRQQFEIVSSASPDAFVATFKPACGGFFGQGTSTQMQLTTKDMLNPSANASVTTLDKVVCESPLSISSGLGLSFIPDKTPAFVAGVQTDANGKPVLDTGGNPTIIQTLGYSNEANVRPAYTLLVNAALKEKEDGLIGVHLATGAMLTAAANGVTTDILAGVSFSFRRRTFFVTPAFDLGLRTEYLSGFTVGSPQGNLTSPPTHQVWKPGFGLAITFPFNQSSSNTNSSGTPSGAQTTTAAPATASPSGTKKQ
jgi:hypothetical protein